MRLIRFAFISFVFLFLLITGISLFIPSHVRISKAINIKADRDSVMAQIKDAGKWKNWYPGVDSAKLLFVEGKPKGVILDNRDSLNPVHIIITNEKEDEVNAQFVTHKMKPVVNGWKTMTFPQSDSLTVQWYMDFHLRWYPWEKFGSLLFEQSYGSKMAIGLTNLKQLLQSPQR